MVEAFLCGLSFLWVRVHPPKDLTTLEGYIVSNYGWRLYRHFFKTYNEKVWAVSASEISADWGAQRIKGMSLWSAVWEPIRASVAGKRRDKSKQVTSLIEEFAVPQVRTGDDVGAVRRTGRRHGRHGPDVDHGPRPSTWRTGRRWPSRSTSRGAAEERIDVSHVISSMPLTSLARIVDPPVPDEVLAAADDLHYRDFLTVALVVPEERGFPDNWIYIHSPDVKVGRIQNFGVWSPFLVKDGRTCLGMEYFVFEGDELWSCSDDELVALATKELAIIGLVEPSDVEAGLRGADAQGLSRSTTTSTATTCEVIRRWFEEHAPNVHPVGRNGMHKYNNQDHSMYTAMLTVENIHGAHHDIWAVNVEEEYHESNDARTDDRRRTTGSDTGPGIPGSGQVGFRSGGQSGSTGRDAPIIPRGAGRVGNVTT